MSKYLVQALLVVAFGIGSLYKFSFFSPDVHVSVLDLVVFVLSLSRLFLLRLHSRLTKPIAIFVFLALISLLLAYFSYGYSATIIGSLYLVRWMIYSIFFASLIRYFKESQLKKLILTIGIIIVISSLFQYIFFPDIRHLAVAEWDPHYFRVVGTLLDPGYTGLLLVFTLIFLTLKPRSLIFWALAYMAFALTYSRSSYLAFLVSMAFIAWKVKGWKFFLLILLLFTVTVAVLPRAPDGEGVKLERTSSIQARIINWQNSLEIFTDNPILGVGFNTYRYAQHEYGFLDESKWQQSHAGAGADSSLLFVAATTGAAGLIAYLWYLRRLYLLRARSYALQASLVAVLVHSVFLNSLFYPHVMLWLSLLTAWSLRSIPFESDSQPDQSLQKPARSLHR